MNTSQSSPRPAVLAVLLAGVTLALYARVAGHTFINLDDPSYVSGNPRVLGGLSWENITWAFTTTTMSNWHPVTWLSHMLDAQLFGAQAGAHHLVNVLLHAANGVLLFHVLRRMTGALWPSAWVAAVFAWHPLHVESVAWVAERKDVLSGLFWMLTLLAYIRYAERPSAGRYAVALLSFALGLLSKPMLVTLPCVLLLLDWWPLRRWQGTAPVVTPSDGPGPEQPRFAPRSLPGLCLEKMPFLLLTVAASVITFLAQRAGQSVVPLEVIPLEFRLVNALMAYATYLGKAIWPVHLAVFYPLPSGHRLELFIIAVLVLLAITAVAAVFWRRRPYLGMGWLWYLGTLVPVIGLVQVGDQALADRYTYLPLVGVCIAAAWGTAELMAKRPAWRRPLQVLGWAALAFWIWIAGVQVSFWKNNQTLFTRALAICGRNYVAETVLGHYALAENRPAEARRFYESALQVHPNYPVAIFGLGNVHAAVGELDLAVARYREALRLHPEMLDTHNALGAVLVRQGKLAEAVAAFTEAIKVEPAFAEAHFNRALASEMRRDFPQAVASYEQVLRLKPASVPALTRLAWLRATAPETGLRNGPEAVRLATRACEMTRHMDVEALNSLAAALAETGQWLAAVEVAQRALYLAQAGWQQETVTLSQQILARAQARQPYRNEAK